MSILMDIISNKNLITLTLILSFLLSAIITKIGIPLLEKLKFKQIIRKEGPEVHLEKQGTPTMGGILIVPIGLLVVNLICIRYQNYHQILAISLLTLSYMLIGIIDDWQSLVNKKNFGLSAKYKLIYQTICSIVFLNWAFLENWINSDIFLYSNYSLNIGILIWPLALFILLAESNATNLTDGLDGLASGCGSLIFTGIALQLVLRESNANYNFAVFCMGMAGTWLGFLIYNKNPAKIFMGDTGSLAMGAALGGVGLITNSLWALLLMGGVLLAESMSVILQVSIFKLTKRITGKGKRFFLMAPLHHHYELQGKHEKSIVNDFWLITICLIVIGIILRSSS